MTLTISPARTIAALLDEAQHTTDADRLRHLAIVLHDLGAHEEAKWVFAKAITAEDQEDKE